MTGFAPRWTWGMGSTSYPDGFFKTPGGWGHYCSRCKHITLASDPPKRGQILKAWCCGQMKILAYGWWQAFRLPKIRIITSLRDLNCVMTP